MGVEAMEVAVRQLGRLRSVLVVIIAVAVFPVAGASAASQGAPTARVSKTSVTKTLVIMVRSDNRYETVRVRLIGKNGRTLDRFNRRVRTNRKVRIRVSAKAQRAKVAIKD